MDASDVDSVSGEMSHPLRCAAQHRGQLSSDLTGYSATGSPYITPKSGVTSVVGQPCAPGRQPSDGGQMGAVKTSLTPTKERPPVSRCYSNVKKPTPNAQKRMSRTPECENKEGKASFFLNFPQKKVSTPHRHLLLYSLGLKAGCGEGSTAAAQNGFVLLPQIEFFGLKCAVQLTSSLLHSTVFLQLPSAQRSSARSE